MLTKKKLKVLLGSLIAIAVGLAAVVVYPSPFYGRQYHYRNVSIHTNHPLEWGWQKKVDKALGVAAACPWFDSTTRFRIFLTPGAPHRLLLRLVDSDVDGINLAVVIYILLESPEIKSRTLGHEMVHTLQIAHLGTRKYLSLPGWIRESYAYYLEYGGRSLHSREKPASPGAETENRSTNCKSHVLKTWPDFQVVKYLLETEGLTVEELHAGRGIDFCAMQRYLNGR